jgi:TRAP-type mannitol/chloroaromatic compound transport system substrate-binding protein
MQIFNRLTHFASTIKNRASQHTNKVFNRACKADPKEKSFLKNFQSFKKNKKRNAQPTRQ